MLIGVSDTGKRSIKIGHVDDILNAGATLNCGRPAQKSVDAHAAFKVVGFAAAKASILFKAGPDFM